MTHGANTAFGIVVFRRCFKYHCRVQLAWAGHSGCQSLLPSVLPVMLPGPVNCTMMGCSDGDNGMVLPLESALFYVIGDSATFLPFVLEKNHSSEITRSPMNRQRWDTCPRCAYANWCGSHLLWSCCGALAALDAHMRAVIWLSQPCLCILSRNAGSSKDLEQRGLPTQAVEMAWWWLVVCFLKSNKAQHVQLAVF